MELLNNLKNALLISILLLFGWGCGVKGRPLPPTNPPPLGRGQSAYSSNKNKTPVKNKYDASQDEDSTETEERK
jgi:hypothetical protein